MLRCQHATLAVGDVEAGTERHGTSSGLLFIVGAAGSVFGVIAPTSRSAIYISPALSQSPLWMSVHAVSWALWYCLLGFGFLGFHRRYGQAFPSSITWLAFMTAVIQVLLVPMIFVDLGPTLVTLRTGMAVCGTSTTALTLSAGGYSLREMREQSKDKVLMETAGTGFIVGGIAVVFPLTAAIASLSSLLMLLLFLEEYRAR